MAFNPIGAITDFVSGGAFGQAKDAAGGGLEAYNNVKLPTAEELQYHLSQLVNNGQMTPEQAQTILADPSQMSSITLDPRLKQAQMEALSSLQDIGQNKGLTDMDRAQLSQIQGQEQTAARGAREAILQNAAQRGVGGSGMELLAQLQNAQDSATRQSARDTSVAGMAQQRALQALQGAGQLGGQIGQQEFGQQAQIAAANDAINQFNAANRNKTNMFNVQNANEAQKYNLQKELDVNKLNTDIKNQQAQANAGAIQQATQNQLAKAGGLAGASNNIAQADMARGQANTNMFGSILGAGATLGSAAIKSKSDPNQQQQQPGGTGSDRNLKTDIKDFDASEFLDSLTPSKYRYKEPEKFGQGLQAGIMAQDLEKTPEGAALVTDTPEGKMVDYNKAGGPLFASLASLHERLKKLEGAS